MPITDIEKKKSTDFMNALHNILFIVESFLDKINEKDYVEICENLQKLSDNKIMNVFEAVTIIQQDPIVRTHRSRTKLTLINRKKIIKKHICPLCDTVVKHLKIHKGTAKCIHIQQTKKLSALSQKLNTNTEYFMTEKLRQLGQGNHIQTLLFDWKQNWLEETTTNPFEPEHY